jgi:CyaY protein
MPSQIMSNDKSMAAMSTDLLSDVQFLREAEFVLARIESQVDRWLDDDLIDIDSQRTGGLLELSLPGGTKIVINTQPPLKELWLAARAGGHHFKFGNGRWLDTRSGVEFFESLSTHLSSQTGQRLNLLAG